MFSARERSNGFRGANMACEDEHDNDVVFRFQLATGVTVSLAPRPAHPPPAPRHLSFVTPAAKETRNVGAFQIT